MKYLTGAATVVLFVLTVFTLPDVAVAATNLIGNPGIEIASGTQPDGWRSGKWGINTVSFTYPVVGRESTVAARIEMTARTSGDAKWYFTPVSAKAGEQFAFSNWYRADVATVLTAQFTHVDGSHSYRDIAFVPPSHDWAEAHAVVTVPNGVVSFTVFHLINRIGWLEVDDYALDWRSGPGACPVRQNDGTHIFEFTKRLRADLGDPYERELLNAALPAGTYDVTLIGADSYVGRTAVSPQTNETWRLEIRRGTELLASTDTTTDLVDGVEAATSTDLVAQSLLLPKAADTLLARHAAPIDSSAPNSLTPVCAIFTPHYEEASSSKNLIENPDVEALVGTSTPASWKKGRWGVNAALFSLTPTGAEGNGLRVSLTTRESGDAKWHFPHVPVTPGASYEFSDWYRADVPTYLTAEYERSDGSKRYTDLVILPPAMEWTKAETTFVAPATAVSVRIFHLINTPGFLETDTFFLGEG